MKSRGLSFRAPERALHYLRFTGYFRLMGYSLEFQAQDPGLPEHSFLPGIDFEDILDNYFFDRDLRLLLLRAIHRVEVALRTCINTTLSEKHGPHWYLDSKHFSDLRNHSDFVAEIEHEVGRSRDLFIEHHQRKYSSPSLPPSWMVGEILSFGAWSRAYKNMTVENRKLIAKHFRIHEVTCKSWSHTVSVLRNLCAHHSRLYNRVFTVSPKITSDIPVMDHQTSRTMYCQASILQAFLNVIAPGSSWAHQLRELLRTRPRITQERMGFPENWFEETFWGLS